MGSSAPEKMTAALWPKPRDASIHADLSLDAGPMRTFLAAVDEAGYRVTPTALIVQAVGHLLVEHPEVNRDVRGARLRDRKAIDAWVTMTDAEGRLSGKRLTDLDHRDVLDVQAEITEEGHAHKQGASTASRVIHALIRWLPLFLLRPLVRVIEFAMHTLRIPVPVQGIGREGFGAVHVTNVGPFGLQHVAAPIPPITGQTVLLAVGEIHEAPVVREGEVTAGWQLPIMATIDHRIVVGINAARWAATLEDVLTSTTWMLDQLPDEAQEAVRTQLTASEAGSG